MQRLFPSCEVRVGRQEGATLLLLLVDGAQLLEEFLEGIVHLGAQRGVVLAHERAVVRLGGVHRLGEQRIAQSNSLLHYGEDLLLFRRLEADGHIAIENDLFEAVVDLFLQNS